MEDHIREAIRQLDHVQTLLSGGLGKWGTATCSSRITDAIAELNAALLEAAKTKQ